jgi:predicted RNase H-like HicB family nuclease
MIIIKKYISVKVLDEKYTVLVERDTKTGWYVGHCKELPDALRRGKTLEALIFNIKEAIELEIVASDRKKFGCSRKDGKNAKTPQLQTFFDIINAKTQHYNG